jgi:hypothetical protein
MTSGRFPFVLQAKVKRYLEFQFRSRKDLQVRQFELMERLSPWLRKEVQVHLNRKVLMQHNFFKTMPMPVLAHACCLAVVIVCAPGDIVIEKGQFIGKMYFLVRGKLHVTPEGNDEMRSASPFSSNPDEEDIPGGMRLNFEDTEPPIAPSPPPDGGGGRRSVFSTADAGFLVTPPAFIGGHNLFSAKVRSYSVTSVAHSELLGIGRRELDDMEEEFPYMKLYMEKYQKHFDAYPGAVQDCSI